MITPEGGSVENKKYECALWFRRLINSMNIRNIEKCEVPLGPAEDKEYADIARELVKEIAPSAVLSRQYTPETKHLAPLDEWNESKQRFLLDLKWYLLYRMRQVYSLLRSVFCSRHISEKRSSVGAVHLGKGRNLNDDKKGIQPCT